MVVNAKIAAMVLGIAFLIAGVLGFIPNPILGANGVFLTNRLHDYVHIGSGIVLLLGAYSPLGATLTLRVVGLIYAIVAVVGFVMGDMVLGVAMNMADHWLHVVLAIVILYAGFGLPEEIRAPATA
ncbi:MAG TPA: DUF4383 domain-containing protein [Rhizomicrobium sp.]|jgi:hypothetical protein|nr:DUF4383 domain-containing protein [Rhizomicrobium sp.]